MTGRQNHQRIVEAAEYLFTTKGYAETSVGDIAEHAGMLKGNLSYYFKTKADLLKSVTEMQRHVLFERIQKDLPVDAGAFQTIGKLLDFIGESAPQLALSGCPFGSLCSELGKGELSLQRYAAQILVQLRDWLCCQFERELPPAKAKTCAEHLLALLQGAALLAHAYQDQNVVFRQLEHARCWLKMLLQNPSDTKLSG